MRTRIGIGLFVIMFIGAFFPHRVQADGIIIPEPPICDPGPCPPLPLPMNQLEIRYHRVTVTISDQVAVTHVDQAFYNPNDWPVEGVYIFPLPRDAAVSDFTLWVDGKPVKGEVLDASQARQIYEDIVRSLRDPALLEYAGQGAVRASIFPIQPGEVRRIELEYSQALSAENGLVRYIYPLNTEKFSAAPLQDVSISVAVTANSPVRAVYSPTHPVDVIRQGETRFTAGYEEKNVLPDKDFALYYSAGESEAFHLLTWRDPSDKEDPDGFFLAMLAPRPDVRQEEVAKDVLIVLDRSGSMDGEKFVQAQQALKFILDHLKQGDRFNIITFSTGVESFASGLQFASAAREAARWVDGLSAMGSTDINRALLEAADMADTERPTYLIFLTDGLPTVGEMVADKILTNLGDAARDNLRLFAFGVGYDVDTFLLDSLAAEHHGASIYVLPGEALDETLSAFYEKISTPVLTDLHLDFGSASVYDVFPNPMPDLFLGSQVIITGRYRTPGKLDIVLSGSVQGRHQEFRFNQQEFTADSRISDGVNESLPRLWATRKIGALLNQIRLHGSDQETVAQIVKLSIRYGIVTPYTSYLVTEDTPLGASAQERIAADQYNLLQATAPSYSGQDAVQKAAGQGVLAGAEAPAAAPAEVAKILRNASGRVFVFSDGVWTDTAYDPDIDETVKIAFLSDEYFALAQSRLDLASALALGERVILSVDGQMVEIVPSGEDSDPVQVNPVSTPTPEPGLTTTPESYTATPLAATQAPANSPNGRTPLCPGAALLVMMLAGGAFAFRRRQK